MALSRLLTQLFPKTRRFIADFWEVMIKNYHSLNHTKWDSKCYVIPTNQTL
jgi:hypothetical protein